jgi:hypothetical protein
MSHCPRTAAVLTVVAGLLGLAAPARAAFIPVDPRATYLKTNNDSAALDAVAIDLWALSFQPGDTIVLERVGDYSPFPAFGDINKSLVGVFSSSPSLLPGSNLNRVVGAIDAGTDWVTPPTNMGLLSTDIAQDFMIATSTGSVTSVTIQVPVGARYLFVTPNDSFFGDNQNPDGDYGVNITGVPGPSGLALAGIGVLGLAAAGWRRRGAVRET